MSDDATIILASIPGAVSMSEEHKGCLSPCRATFERLAKEAPELLIVWAQTGYALDNADLSFACQAIGEKIPEDERRRLDYDARVALMTHVFEHASPIVREGAVMGLAGLGDGSLSALLQVSREDASPGVRAAAVDAIERIADERAARGQRASRQGGRT